MSPIARIAVPDLVTNSYFPALAGEELGFYRAEGLDGRVELLAPAPRAMAALRDGEVDFVVTGAHTALTVFPGFKRAKLAVAVAQGTPWLLVMRADLPAARGDVRAVKGLRIGAAPGPDAALVRLLAEAGVDPARDGVQIARVPGTERPGTSFGVLVAAQRALRANPERAAEVGRRRFPPAAAEMIAGLVERDLPFYDPTISEASVAAVSAFARALGLLAAPVAYDDVVATRFRDLWML